MGLPITVDLGHTIASPSQIGQWSGPGRKMKILFGSLGTKNFAMNSYVQYKCSDQHDMYYKVFDKMYKSSFIM